MISIPMKLRVSLFIVAAWMISGYAAGQSAGQELPSAPSASAQQEAPPKPEPPATKSTPKPHKDNELRPGDNTTPAAPSSNDSAKHDPPSASEAPPPATSDAAQPSSAGGTGSGSGSPATDAAPATSTPAPASTQPKLEDVPQGESESSFPTIVVHANEVRVIFTVTDKRGRYIKDLKERDFRVLDDKKLVEKIRSFRSETDLPLQVGLLVDASNSVRDRFKFEQEAAIEFLNSIIRPRYDLAFTVGFDSTPDVTQDFTDNTELLSKGVRALRPGGGTAMYDALYYACRDKLIKQVPTGPVRRAIILLSDGDDNSSHVTREEAIEMAQRAEVIVYTISTNVTGSKGKGDKVLERIAEATGGRAFFPFQVRDVTDAFGSIQDELRSQYWMSYRPPDFVADGHFRTIEILAQEKGYRVRARKGYFAPRH